ncbi:MAG: hypothetical protein RR705_00735 [Lachnospiraceae bacterium]
MNTGNKKYMLLSIPVIANILFFVRTKLISITKRKNDTIDIDSIILEVNFLRK